MAMMSKNGKGKGVNAEILCFLFNYYFLIIKLVLFCKITRTQNYGKKFFMNSASEQTPKRKRGRPRSFTEGSLANICVSIEAQQKQWLDEIAASAPHESASKVVREALDLWHAVHKEGMVLTTAAAQHGELNGDDDDFDYSWH